MNSFPTPPMSAVPTVAPVQQTSVLAPPPPQGKFQCSSFPLIEKK